MSNAAPGPWAIFPHPDPSCPAKAIGPIDGDFCGAHTTVYINHEANARLIAQAPTMAEFVDLVANFTEPGRDSEDDAETLRSLIRSARRIRSSIEAADHET